MYVDDIIIANNNEAIAKSLKSSLDTRFKLKYLGNLRFFLGLEIVRSEKGIYIS